MRCFSNSLAWFQLQHSKVWFREKEGWCFVQFKSWIWSDQSQINWLQTETKIYHGRLRLLMCIQWHSNSNNKEGSIDNGVIVLVLGKRIWGMICIQRQHMEIWKISKRQGASKHHNRCAWKPNAGRKIDNMVNVPKNITSFSLLCIRG